MAFSLGQFRRLLKVRLRTTMTLVGLSVVIEGIEESGNLDLDDPIAVGATAVGATIADLTLPTDDEIAAIPDGKRYAAVAVAVLQSLLNIRTNWTLVTAKVDVLQENLSDLIPMLDKAISYQTAVVRDDYGIIGGVTVDPPAAGVPVSGVNCDPPRWHYQRVW